MPESAIPGLYRCTIEWTGHPAASGSMLNVLHYKDTSSPPSDDDNQTVADAFATTVQDFYDANPSGLASALSDDFDNVFPGSVTVRNINKDTIAAGAQAVTSGGGDLSGDLPAEIALVCTLGSNVIGRSNRGRMYLPSPSNAQNVEGRPTLGLRNVYEAAVEEFLSGFTTTLGNYELAVYSRLLDAYQLVTVYRVRQAWDSCRNRGVS